MIGATIAVGAAPAIAVARQRGNIDLSVQVTDITAKGDTPPLPLRDYAYDGPVKPTPPHLTVRAAGARSALASRRPGWQDAESAYPQ